MGIILGLGAGVVLIVFGSIILWDKWSIFEGHCFFGRVIVAGLFVLIKYFEIEL
jgi:hypothetical protein